MQIDICVPDLGFPSDQPIRLSLWYAEEGDMLAAGDRLAELVVPGATVDLDAPEDGLLTQRLVGLEEPLRVGQKIATMETFEWPSDVSGVLPE